MAYIYYLIFSCLTSFLSILPYFFRLTGSEKSRTNFEEINRKRLFSRALEARAIKALKLQHFLSISLFSSFMFFSFRFYLAGYPIHIFNCLYIAELKMETSYTDTQTFSWVVPLENLKTRKLPKILKIQCLKWK